MLASLGVLQACGLNLLVWKRSSLRSDDACPVLDYCGLVYILTMSLLSFSSLNAGSK